MSDIVAFTQRDAILLEKLERRLLEPGLRSDAEELSGILHDGFVEVDGRGQMHDKADVLAALAAETSHGHAIRLAEDFRVRFLPDDFALVTYIATRRIEGRPDIRSIDSSIWRLVDGRWQLTFHQGTALPPGKSPA